MNQLLQSLEVRDVVTLAALLISIASLITSLLVFRFNRRVKSIELRAQLLVKMAEAKISAINLDEFFRDLADEARASNQGPSERIAGFAKRVTTLKGQIERAYETVSAMKAGSSVDLFQHLFHTVSDLQMQLADLRASAQSDSAKQEGKSREKNGRRARKRI